MTNPNDIVRVRARNGGRASVYEANAWAQGFSAGLLEGNGVTQNTSADMNVLVGGSSTKPDVLIATNPAGYKIALDIVGQQAIAITAPASDSRISSIVAYTDDLAIASEDTDVTGSPSSCGLIVVNGSTAASPTAPDDTAIRAAITEDGATGSQASYVVIANITVASTTTTITNSLISIKSAAIGSDKVDCTYYAGDSISIGSATTSASGESLLFVTGGYITSGQTSIAFNIPLPKSAIGTNPRFTSGLIWARTVSGNNAINGVNITLFSTTITPLNNHSLGVQVRNGNGAQFPNTTNNTPLAIAGYFTINFE